MRLFLRYEESFHECILCIKIFDFVSVERLSEQRTFLCKLYRTKFTEPIPRFWFLSFWVSAGKMTPPQASFTDSTTFFFKDLWQARDVHPLFSFFMEIFQCCMPSSLIKIYLYAMNINIFITNCMWYRLKTKQVINWQKSWTIISSNNINLVCEAYSSMTPSFSNGLSFEKGLGLLITPLCFFCLQ